MKVAHTRATASFGDAFNASRDAGCQEFVWRGKRYHTRRSDDPETTQITQITQPIIEHIEDTPCVPLCP